MSEDKSLESLGINLPKPLTIHTVKSGRRFMQLNNTPIYLAVNYELISFMGHVSTCIAIRIIQKAASQEDEVLLVGEQVTWDKDNNVFRNPKSMYPVFVHPASPVEVVEALKEDGFFLKMSNILNSVYDIQISPVLLESGLLSLDYYLSSPENVRPPKTAIKI